MSNNNSKDIKSVKDKFSASAPVPVNAGECSMEELANYGFAQEPNPNAYKNKAPRPLGPGSAVGE